MAKKLTEDQFDHSMKSLAEQLGLEYNPISGLWRKPFAHELAANRAGHQRASTVSDELMASVKAGIEDAQRQVNQAVGKRDEEMDSLRRNIHKLHSDFKMLTDYLGVLFVNIPEARTIQKIERSEPSNEQ